MIPALRALEICLLLSPGNSSLLVALASWLYFLCLPRIDFHDGVSFAPDLDIGSSPAEVMRFHVPQWASVAPLWAVRLCSIPLGAR